MGQRLDDRQKTKIILRRFGHCWQCNRQTDGQKVT